MQNKVTVIKDLTRP